MVNCIKMMMTSLMITGGLMVSCTGNLPQKSDNLKQTASVYPVLKNELDNQVMKITFNNPNDLAELSEVVVDILNTDKHNIDNVKLYFTGSHELFNNAVLFGSPSSVTSGKITFKGKQFMKRGVNHLWVSCHVSKNASAQGHISTKLSELTVDGKRLIPSNDTFVSKQRLGVSVRDKGVDGVHTYRIPGLTTTNDGTLLAIYDVRRDKGRDLQGNIDIGVSRSTDKGKSWEPMRIALDMGAWGNLPEKFNGVSDANILVDKNTGDIFIAGLWMYGVISPEGKWLEGLNEESSAWNHQWRNRGSQAGLDVKQTSQFLITKSSDDGKTWSDPVNITQMCKKKEWWLYAPAPGAGITLKDGTLVFPTQGRDKKGLPFSNITYSKDGGKTWTTSAPAAHNTTECMAVELGDGSIMLNMRDNRNRKNKGDNNGRNIAITQDLGDSWTPSSTSHNALIEPVCMASIIRHDYIEEGEKKHVLLFSNPNSKRSRSHQTIKVSFDDGKTWPKQFWMELDAGRGAGYSCLTSIDNENIGILYEGSVSWMTFQSIPLKELLTPKQKRELIIADHF
ncbi:exo-alpha-sialidase [Halosquirtibacter xylanolyticus]|uniref:sialidase family protein n=1 Tax=Halosquirtibacter xylanolyticus TaxID=3374599 RepID=UPI00374A3C14|nr:exo-alpha-sialidase [Prolixibacteraceae bacterium]